jgi:hypothetical protein
MIKGYFHRWWRFWLASMGLGGLGSELLTETHPSPTKLAVYTLFIGVYGLHPTNPNRVEFNPYSRLSQMYVAGEITMELLEARSLQMAWYVDELVHNGHAATKMDGTVVTHEPQWVPAALENIANGRDTKTAEAEAKGLTKLAAHRSKKLTAQMSGVCSAYRTPAEQQHLISKHFAKDFGVDVSSYNSKLIKRQIGKKATEYNKQQAETLRAKKHRAIPSKDQGKHGF